LPAGDPSLVISLHLKYRHPCAKDALPNCTMPPIDDSFFRRIPSTAMHRSSARRNDLLTMQYKWDVLELVDELER
jgi:hypothetical protein